MLESDYTHAESPKPPPEVPVRVFLKSQLMAALRQHSRPIIIEDPDLALPFTRMLRARELRLKSVGGTLSRSDETRGSSVGQNLDASSVIASASVFQLFGAAAVAAVLPSPSAAVCIASLQRRAGVTPLPWRAIGRPGFDVFAAQPRSKKGPLISTAAPQLSRVTLSQ